MLINYFCHLCHNIMTYYLYLNIILGLSPQPLRDAGSPHPIPRHGQEFDSLHPPVAPVFWEAHSCSPSGLPPQRKGRGPENTALHPSRCFLTCFPFTPHNSPASEQVPVSCMR